MRKDVSTIATDTIVAVIRVIPAPVRIGARITNGTAVQSPGGTAETPPTGAGVKSLSTAGQRRNGTDK
jgi:hypothetical protein